MSGLGLLTRAAADLTGVGFGSSTSIADIDEDGNQDLLITGNTDRPLNSGKSTTLYLGNGQASFTRVEADLPGVDDGYISVADVDGDGNLDVLMIGNTPGKGEDGSIAALYLGDGQGGFTNAGLDLTGLDGGSTSIADVDRDGNLDFLLTGSDRFPNPHTDLYLGDGQGGFSKKGEGLPDVFASAASIADVNGDGNPDLLVTGNTEGLFLNTSGKLTALYLGNGQGEFTEAEADLVDVDYSSTSIADVNGDDNPDLLVTGENKNLVPTATLYLGDGQGGFTKAGADLAGIMFGSTSIADVNGDGNPDLLLAGKNSITSGGTSTTLYLGDGQGGFTTAEAGLFGVREGSTSIADIDDDGDSDLLVTGNEIFGERFSARLYVNPISKTPPNQAPRWAHKPKERSLASGVALQERTLAPGVTLRRRIEAGDPDGDSLSLEFISPTSNATFTDFGKGVAAVSFTPDRTLGGDVANIVVDASDPHGATNTLSTRIEVPPTLAVLKNSFVNVENGATSIADVNGDGNKDLLITGEDVNNDPSTVLYLGDGEGDFTEAEADLTDVGFSSTSVADVNNDGNPDLLIVGDDEPGAVLKASATLYLGDGEGGFTEANAGLDGAWHGSTSIADVNEDGNPDLLITGLDGDGRTATLYLGDGEGGFSKANSDIREVSDSYSLIAHVDGDEHLDIVITGVAENIDRIATLYLGDGEGNFAKAGASLTGVERGSISTADVNEDENQDLLITGEPARVEDPTTTLYLGNGDGGFTEANAGLTQVKNGSTSIADVNGDGNQDLFITGSDNARVGSAALYLGNGQGEFSEANVGLAGLSFSSTAIGDIDGDGDPDLLTTGLSEASLSRATILYENLLNSTQVIPPEVPTGLTAEVEGQQVSLSWNAVADPDLVGYRLYRGVGKAPDTSGQALTEGFLSDTAYTDTSIARDQTYRYGVTAVDIAGNESALSVEASAFLPPQFVEASISRSFGEASGPGDYRLVALPGRADTSLARVLEGEAGAQWQAYLDDGSQENFLQRYDGSEAFRFESGNGFWVTSTSDLTFEASVPAVALKGDTAAAIDLQAGWNVISNPLGKDVAWTEVEAATGTDLQPVWAFGGSFDSTSTFASAAEGGAYYFFNEAEGLDSLVVPYPGAPGKNDPTSTQITSKQASPQATTSEKRRALVLSASAGGRSVSQVSVTLAGSESQEEALIAPPGRFEPVSLRIRAEENSSEDTSRRGGLFMADWRVAESGGATFPLQLTSRAKGQVRLSAEGLQEAGIQEARLLRPNAGSTYDLGEKSTITVSPKEGETVELELAVGTEGYVEDEAESVLPDEVTLKSYPNPVWRQGTLEYALPEASEVSIKVYDILGREVVTLQQGRMQAGRHQVTFEVERFSSGVYFGRLEASGQTRTQKITVVR
jgi:hypothetical protein